MSKEKELLISKAQKVLREGKKQKAITLYEEALKLDGKDIRVIMQLGNLYAQTAVPEKAFQFYQDAAMLLKKDGFYSRAVAVYKEMLLLGIADKEFEIFTEMSKLYRSLGLSKEADECHLKANSAKPQTQKPQPQKKAPDDSKADLFNIEELPGIAPELHKKIALKLIATDEAGLVVENLFRFAELDQAIAVALVKAGFGLEVMNNLDYFDGLDYDIVAMAMLLSGQGGFVKLNQELFPGLTTETLDKLNDSSYQPTPEDIERIFGQIVKID